MDFHICILFRLLIRLFMGTRRADKRNTLNQYCPRMLISHEFAEWRGARDAHYNIHGFMAHHYFLRLWNSFSPDVRHTVRFKCWQYFKSVDYESNINRHVRPYRISHVLVAFMTLCANRFRKGQQNIRRKEKKLLHVCLSFIQSNYAEWVRNSFIPMELKTHRL